MGYMRSDFVTQIGDDSAYQAYLSEQGFPKTYQPLSPGTACRQRRPVGFCGLSYGAEMVRCPGERIHPGPCPYPRELRHALRSTAPGAYNSNTGEWKQYEPDWYAASRQTVAYYLDPRSYLTDGTCIAFEQLSGGEGVTHAQLKKVLADCAWATDAIIDEFIRAGSKEELEKQKQIDLERPAQRGQDRRRQQPGKSHRHRCQPHLPGGEGPERDRHLLHSKRHRLSPQRRKKVL